MKETHGHSDQDQEAAGATDGADPTAAIAAAMAAVAATTEDPPTAASRIPTSYTVAVVIACGVCGGQTAASTGAIVAASLRGDVIECNCMKCKVPLRATAAPQCPRLMQAQPANRHMRRSAKSGLILPR